MTIRKEMLNRIKKILIVTVLSASLTSGLALASQSTISYVNVNDLAYQDVEIVITDDSKILVPFKQLATLFNIQYSANRTDRNISFKTYDGKDGIINPNGVFVEDSPISKNPPIFLTAGIMDGVFNEAYITPDVAAKLFGVKLDTDYENLAINAQVDRDIPLLASNNLLTSANRGPHAYTDIVTPKKPGKITLNKIGLNSHMINDNMSSRTPTYHSSSNTFNMSTQASLNGNIMGGKYRVEATEYNYTNKAFLFGGVSGSYANKFTSKEDGKTYWYELGKVTGKTDDETQIGTNIFGAQMWNYDYNRENPSYIHGYVKPTSLVRVTANDSEPVTLSTYAGYYTLKDIQLPYPLLKLVIEEINEDGTVEVIREEKYNLYGDRPFQNENRGSIYAGVWGYQNRLFREGQNIYLGNNKKFTTGAYYQMGLKDNVTAESKFTFDNIYEKSNSKVIYKLPTSDGLLVTGTQKNTNYLSGATTLNSIEWVSEKDRNLKGRAIVGASIAEDIRNRETHLGYMGKLVGEYEKDLTEYSMRFFKPKSMRGKLEAFHSSSDWYIASTDGTSKNDRTGGKASASFSFNQTSVGGSYSRYLSNLNHRYQGGTIVFDEASVSASSKIPYLATARFSGNYRHGENHLGRNQNYFYDGNITRNIGKWSEIQAGYRESLYDTKYNHEEGFNRNIYSKYYDNYIETTTPIPGNFGTFGLGHSFVRYKSDRYKNGYNIFRFRYTFPTWRNWTLSLLWGLKYYGQTGNDLGVNVSHRSRSGQTMSVGYLYSRNSGYFIDNLFAPTTNRHSVTFTFNDAFQPFHHGFKSVGTEDLNNGIFEAVAFIDNNRNGVYDKKYDVPVKNVPIIASWAGETFLTNRNGRVCSTSLSDGVYNVSVDMDNLPITVAPVSNDIITRTVKINGGQTTKLEIPLVSTIGSVSGKLSISDEFQRDLKITDFIIVLLDEEGNEVNYSTVGYDGDFYISGLAPGRYRLQLDDRYISAYGLEEVQNRSYREIFIPYDYENPVDVVNQNLEYRTLSL